MIRNNWMSNKNAWMNQYDMRSHEVFSVMNNIEKQNHNEQVNQGDIKNSNLVMNYNDIGKPNE